MIVLGGRRFEVSGAPDTRNPLDHALPWVTDGHERTRRIEAVVVHTTKGRTGPLLAEDAAPSERAERYAHYQAGSRRDVSWDFTVDLDGTVVQSNDPSAPCGGRSVPWVSWHAGHANEWSIGVEIVQTEGRALYLAQLRVAVALVGFLCAQYGIPRRVPVDGQGVSWEKPIYECVSKKREGRQRSVEGVLNHCHVTTPDSRGPGDAGPHVRAEFLAGGFEGFDVTGIARR